MEGGGGGGGGGGGMSIVSRDSLLVVKAESSDEGSASCFTGIWSCSPCFGGSRGGCWR